jgi:hypothetical protein
MGSSVFEINKEMKAAIKYEAKVIKFHEKEALKRKLEEIFGRKIIRYQAEERKRKEMEKLLINDNKFIISKKDVVSFQKTKRKVI